ncbi:protein-glutamine gamma-glutamyltransferase K-like [Amphiura filiformis]|uniref:protein-glutamine gamma-glutamyltransferase K-like n=1 Tax=Amphiura filiformis TaxID=82378 RepID=UPI003B2133EA
MGSGASNTGGAGTERGLLTREMGPNGRRRLIYEFEGRRYDVSAILERRRQAIMERERTRSSRTVPPTSTPDDKPATKPLPIIKIDDQKTNRIEHHTAEYDSKEFIVRRGQPFRLAVTFGRPYNADTDDIILDFSTGNVPSYSKGTKLVFPVQDKLEEGKWGAQVESSDGTTVVLKVQSSCNSPIGYYALSVKTKVKDGDENSESSYPYPDKIYIIFNPWCKQDAVYMESDEEKEEYVLNETGYQFYGNSKRVKKRTWNFGQFEEASFEAAMYLLQDCREPVVDYERNNPIIVSRKMSAAVNVQDDGGILVGRWSKTYPDGVKPTKWNGSVDILEQYMKEKTPVKYGQCWVFSGVLTTILRSLGIPARSVTNFASAHDTDSSMTIDKHVDTDGESIKWMDTDSVWNFHVWNDAWMTRPDLPPGYGGWQAVDSTPQETSEGICQCGPASVNAIKQGHVYLPYDTRFIFAEINGDKVYWEVTDPKSHDPTLKKIRIEKSAVGKGLYTKVVGDLSGEDINGQYKHKDGSMEERLAVETAVERGSKPDTYSPDVPEVDDIAVDIDVDADDKIFVGDDFAVGVKLTNKSAEERNVDLSVIIQICYYTGVLADKVKKERRSVVVAGSQSTEALFKVKVDDYVDKLVDQSSMKIFLLGRVKETKQTLVDQEDFRLRTPNLDLSVSNTKLKVNQEFTVDIALKNPLPRTLTKCTFNLEGAGLQKPKVINLNNVSPRAEVKQKVTLKAQKPGRRTLIVDFDSDQLSQVHGDVDLEIKP